MTFATNNQVYTITKSTIALNSPALRVAAQIDRVVRKLPVIRRQLHQHPELSGSEYATTSYLGKQLAAAKIPYRLGTGKRGIITDIVPASDALLILMPCRLPKKIRFLIVPKTTV